MNVGDKGMHANPLSPTPGEIISSSEPKHPEDKKIDVVAHEIITHQHEGHPAPLPSATPPPEDTSTITQVAAKTLFPLDPETLRKWENVQMLFEEMRPALAATVPEGCAAYLQLVLPKHVEDQIGRMEFRAGRTGCAGGGQAVGDRTLANIGSSGKPITALMAAILEESGHLRFTDSIARYFPKEVMEKFRRDVNGTPVDPASITLGMLASMTAGLTYDGAAGVNATAEERTLLSHDEILRDRTADRSIAFMARPGDGICTYSNMQMQLLAYGIEKAHKEKAFKTLLESRVDLAEKTIGSFLDKGFGRLGQDQIPERLRQMTLRDFEREVSNPYRQDASIDGVNVHDVISDILGQETPLDTPSSFEELLNKEFFQPLGMEEATYAPKKEVIQEGRVLAIGTPEDLARGQGYVSPPDSARNGAGTLFLTPANEAKFVQAMLSPSLKTPDGHRTLISPEKMNALFARQNRNLPSWTVGGTDVNRGANSDTIGKGGCLDQYHHFFKWERMSNPSKQDEAFGIFMWNNFNGTPNDGRLGECFGKLYGQARSILQSEPLSTSMLTSIEPTGPTTLENGQELVPQAEQYFQGDQGLLAYAKNQFLYWAGVMYRIQEHEGKEYIFQRDQQQHDRPVPIQFFDSPDKKMRYIQVGDAQASEISRERVLEAASTPRMQHDLKEAKDLVHELQGNYVGDHKPSGFNGSFVENPKGILCLCPNIPLQVIAVHRDGNDKIDEIHTTWSDEPPNKMMKFVRNQEGSWDMKITEFLTGTLCETCEKA